MRFGEELWCAPAHAALLRLQETELHLMESMKRWMAQRARSERDFSVQLHQMAAMLERQSRPPAADYISQLHKVRSHPHPTPPTPGGGMAGSILLSSSYWIVILWNFTLSYRFL